MSLLKMIAEYDYERESYIASLEAEIADLKKRLNENMDLLMRGEALRHKEMLRGIMAGAYDGLRKPSE